MKKRFGFFSFLILIILLLANMFSIDANINNNFVANKTATNVKEEEGVSVESITLGEERVFDVYNGQEQFSFIVTYHYTDRIDMGDGNLKYVIDITIENVINTNPTSYLHYEALDANDGTEYLNKVVTFSLGYQETYTETFELIAPKEAHLQFRVGVEYNSLYYSDWIYLLSFDRPTIENIQIEKNIENPTSVYVTWDFVGDASVVIADKTVINGTGIPIDTKFDPTLEKYEIVGLSPNTLYDDWQITIAYESGFNLEVGGKIVVQDVPDFATLYDGIENVVKFEYGELNGNLLEVQVSFEGILPNSITYTNLTFISQNNSLEQSFDINVNSDQTISIILNVNEKTIYKDLVAKVSFVDALNYNMTYEVKLGTIATSGYELKTYVAISILFSIVIMISVILLLKIIPNKFVHKK